jgi:threonine dehydrogenase-like Zn-dependent dehydrogenase
MLTMPAVTIHAKLACREGSYPGAMGRYRDVLVALEDHAIPQAGPGEVLVQVQTTAVCGSDIHAVQRGSDGFCASSVPAQGWERPTGLRLGHEYAGVVVAVGPDVAPNWKGEWVSGDSLICCRRCPVCRDGNLNHCPNASLLGLERHGTFAPFVVVPASSLVRLGPLRQTYGADAMLYGCLLEPLGVAAKAVVEALRHRPAGASRSLLVHGGGPIGLMAGLVGKCLSFDPILVIEPTAARRNLAQRIGLLALDLNEWVPHSISALFGCGAAVVIDACGQLDAARLLSGVRSGGVVVCLARTGRDLAWPTDRAMTQGITLVGSRGHVGYLPWVQRRMATGRLDPRPLVTRYLAGLPDLADWLQHPDRFATQGKVLCRVAA